jgi:hypothetical protein
MITNIIQWIVLSSKDPRKVSLFVKGGLTMIVGSIAGFLSVLGIDLGVYGVDEIIVNIGQFIEFALQAIGYGMMVWGGIRKIFLTIEGKNHIPEN